MFEILWQWNLSKYPIFYPTLDTPQRQVPIPGRPIPNEKKFLREN